MRRFALARIQSAFAPLITDYRSTSTVSGLRLGKSPEAAANNGKRAGEMRPQRLSNQMKSREKQLRAAELCFAGKSCREVAKEMGCSLSVAHQRITRGKELVLPRESAVAAYITARERINEIYAVNHTKMLEGDDVATRHCQKSIDQWLKLHQLEGDNAITTNIVNFSGKWDKPGGWDDEPRIVDGKLIDPRPVHGQIEFVEPDPAKFRDDPSPVDKYEPVNSNGHQHREATVQRANDAAYQRAAGRPVRNGAIDTGPMHWKFKP